MRALLGLILLVTAPLAARPQASEAAFTPDTVLQMPGGLRIVVLRSDPGGVAALRLSIPFVETAAEAGAGRMLAALAERRMAGVARQVGSRVSASRTPWGLAYSVEGAEADLDYLAYLLRLATAQPRPENGIVELIRAELILDLERQDESPGDRLLADLRRTTAPDLSPLGGSHSSVRLLDQARLRAVWQRTHLAPSMSLVAMTSASAVTLLAMLEQIGLPKVEVTEPMNAPDSGVVNRGPPPPGSWYAEARVDHAVADPHAAVAAHLLVVAGTALSRPAITSLKETVRSALADFSDSLDAHQVALAVGRVGREYRARARTPGGLVEQVGHMADRTGGSSDASLYLAGLGRVTAESLAAYLDGLGAPVAVESAR